MYYALFNDKGERITTYIPGVNCEAPPEGAILISDEEQQLYCTGEYIRGTDGKPVKKVLSPDQIKQQKISQLTAERENKLSQLLIAAEKAKILGNSITTIDTKYQSTIAEYKTKIAAVANGTV